LYYSEEIKARDAPQSDTQKKILTMLKRHFSEHDAPKVLEMIIMSYHLRLNFPELQREQLDAMRKLMSRLIATAHYDRKIKEWVWSSYQEILRSISSGWDFFS
jgi:isocitrate dehydrogenase kinase/phosphatase